MPKSTSYAKVSKDATGLTRLHCVTLCHINITKDYVLDMPIPLHFLDKVVDMSTKFAQQQIDTINKVIGFVHDNSHGRYGSIYIDKRQYNELKKKSFDEWKERFDFN